MNVNGVTSNSMYASAYATNTSEKKVSEDVKEKDTVTSTTASEGVVYEKSTDKTETKNAVSSTKKYQKNPALVAQLKADADARTQQFRSLVEQLICKQGQTIGKATDIYSFLREGNFTVDPVTQAQAQADIAEDGYWGVEQTSARIFDFAMALCGGTEEGMDEMLVAFKKGFEQATQTWGGELPDISQRTYDAVLKKFQEYKEKEFGTTTEA